MKDSIIESLSALLKRGLEKLAPSALKADPIENPAQPLERSKNDAFRPTEDRSTIAVPIKAHTTRTEQRPLLPDSPQVSTIEDPVGAVVARDNFCPAHERLNGAENHLSRSAKAPDPRFDSQPQEPEPYGPFTLRPFKAEEKIADSALPTAEINRFELFRAKPVDERVSERSGPGASTDFKEALDSSSSTDAALSKSPVSKLAPAAQVTTPDPTDVQSPDAPRSAEEKKGLAGKASAARKTNESDELFYEDRLAGLASAPEALSPSAPEANSTDDAIAGRQATLHGETSGLDTAPSLEAPQASTLSYDIENDQKNVEERLDRAESKARNTDARDNYPEDQTKNSEFSAQKTLEDLKSEPQTQAGQSGLRDVSLDSEAFGLAAFKASSAYSPSRESGTIVAAATDLEPENASKVALTARSGAIASGSVDQAPAAGLVLSTASDLSANAERTERARGLSSIEQPASRAHTEAASGLSSGVSPADPGAQTETRGTPTPSATLVAEESSSPGTLPGVPRTKELSRDADSEKIQKAKIESSDSRPHTEESRFQKPTETRTPDEARAVPAQQEGGTVAHVTFNVETAATTKTTEHASDRQAIERESPSHANNARAGSRGPAAEETKPGADPILSDRVMAAQLFGQNLANVDLGDDRPLNNRKEREMAADQWSSQNNPQRTDSPSNIDTVLDRKYELSIDL